MIALIQKVTEASVRVDEKIVGQIGNGILLLLGIKTDDTEKDLDYLVEKVINLRIFEEGEKYFDKSLLEKNYAILVVSQFTLYAGTKNGRRPDFIDAAKGEVAEPLYNEFINRLKSKGISVATGVFGAMMNVSLVNNGPVTIIIDSNQKNNGK